ncbi:hypothetical protein MCOR25_006440 [Pyricularia grisea]|uniref:Apple domain-containing protein n=1 Tax=Pyricularia grisea TaxID=148305 RepID=A0A6P8BDS0_PYRGI|nr:uncharacterized protein PgNI_05050 [Pyricularia grisea]KAI6361600.1 hypothetical protein MCOR25_006440 [Pyricularia grisea]TLD14021.1 hypothetical protein PgNI_05050 [Pyricularia grisea]
MGAQHLSQSGLEVVNNDMQGLQAVHNSNNDDDGRMYSPSSHRQPYNDHWGKTDRSTIATPIPSEYRQTPAFTPAEMYHAPPHAPTHSSETKRGKPVPFGLNPWVFAAMAALIGMIISGAVVGGVLGAQLASSPSSRESTQTTVVTTSGQTTAPTPNNTPQPASTTSSSSSQTVPTTALENYSVASPKDVKMLQWDCPRIDKSSILSTFDKKRFDIECGIDSQNQGAEAPGALSVISVHYAYNLEACLDACAVMNKRSGDAGRDLKCRLVVFHAGMRDNVDKGGNCFLKNATRAEGNNGNTNPSLLTASLVD